MLSRGGSTPLDVVKLKLWDLLPNGHTTDLYAMRHRHPDRFKTDIAENFRLLADGKIKPMITQTLPQAEARRAHV